MEQQRIVDTWVKLEKCLNDFDVDMAKKSNRPMSSAPAPNRFQISRKRPDSSQKMGGAGIFPIRPMTTNGERRTKRPISSMSHMASPNSAGRGKSALAQSMNFNKIINSLPLDKVIALYEARCQDTQVE